MSELVPKLHGAQLSRQSRRELEEAQQRALVRAGKMILETELFELEEELAQRIGRIVRRGADLDIKDATDRAKTNPTSAPIQTDIAMDLHEWRTWRLTQRRLP